jgi:branched-subunit amino acid transport protein AzlD
MIPFVLMCCLGISARMLYGMLYGVLYILSFNSLAILLLSVGVAIVIAVVAVVVVSLSKNKKDAALKVILAEKTQADSSSNM